MSSLWLPLRKHQYQLVVTTGKESSAMLTQGCTCSAVCNKTICSKLWLNVSPFFTGRMLPCTAPFAPLDGAAILCKRVIFSLADIYACVRNSWEHTRCLCVWDDGGVQFIFAEVKPYLSTGGLEKRRAFPSQVGQLFPPESSWENRTIYRNVSAREGSTETCRDFPSVWHCPIWRVSQQAFAPCHLFIYFNAICSRHWSWGLESLPSLSTNKQQ